VLLPAASGIALIADAIYMEAVPCSTTVKRVPCPSIYSGTSLSLEERMGAECPQAAVDFLEANEADLVLHVIFLRSAEF